MHLLESPHTKNASGFSEAFFSLLSPSLNKVRIYTASHIHHTSLSYCAATFVYSLITAHCLIATDRLFYAMPVGSSSGFIRSSSMMPDGRRTEPDGRRTDQDAQFSGKVANKRPK